MPKYFEFEVSLREVKPRIWRRFLLRKSDAMPRTAPTKPLRERLDADSLTPEQVSELRHLEGLVATATGDKILARRYTKALRRFELRVVGRACRNPSSSLLHYRRSGFASTTFPATTTKCWTSRGTASVAGSGSHRAGRNRARRSTASIRRSSHGRSQTIPSISARHSIIWCIDIAGGRRAGRAASASTGADRGPSAATRFRRFERSCTPDPETVRAQDRQSSLDQCSCGSARSPRSLDSKRSCGAASQLLAEGEFGRDHRRAA